MYMYKNKFRMLRESLRHKRSFNLRLSEFAMKKRNVYIAAIKTRWNVNLFDKNEIKNDISILSLCKTLTIQQISNFCKRVV